MSESVFCSALKATGSMNMCRTLRQSMGFHKPPDSIRFLQSPDSVRVMKQSGLEPLVSVR